MALLVSEEAYHIVEEGTSNKSIAIHKDELNHKT